MFQSDKEGFGMEINEFFKVIAEFYGGNTDFTVKMELLRRVLSMTVVNESVVKIEQ